MATVLKDMGRLEIADKKPEKANEYLKEALQKFNELKNYLGMANVLRAMGEWEEKFGTMDIAINHYLSALKLYERTEILLGRVNCEASLCYADAKIDDNENALKYMKKIKEALKTSAESINIKYATWCINKAQEHMDKTP
jgi:tetratricopeptide (TPR) repeat protein